MKALLTSIAVLFLLFGFYAAKSQSADSIKCWNNEDRLRWIDFESKVPLSEAHSNTRAVCPHQIVVFPFRDKGKLDYKVKLFFEKRRAWTKDTTSYALAHEQLHFDIGELYARKLRRAIRKMRDTSTLTGSDVKIVIERLLYEEEKEQNVYDNETAHGIYKNRQLEWRDKITKDLEALNLKEFGSNPGDCK